jgi:hypothetical protein
MTLVPFTFPTAPGKVGNIVVSARSPSSLAFGWDAPSGGVEGYTVSLEGAHPAVQCDNSTRTATFNSLSAGTEYTVRMVTLSGDQQSETVENKFYTSKYKQPPVAPLVYNKEATR